MEPKVVDCKRLGRFEQHMSTLIRFATHPTNKVTSDPLIEAQIEQIFPGSILECD
jgi:hypothetical protein